MTGASCAQGTFSPMLRDMAAGKLISNLPIVLGSTGWLACAVIAIAQNPARGSRSIGISVVALWAISGVGSGRKDLLVVDILKHIFRRCGSLWKGILQPYQRAQRLRLCLRLCRSVGGAIIHA